MAIGWLDTEKVDALADKLVSELIHRIPPGTVGTPGKKGESKMERTRSVILQQAGEFASANPLNIYKKAKLANRFKWALIEAGYPTAFVNAMSFDLAAVMAPKKGKKKIGA